jgi:3-oxoacyl-[acyl-carrier protein] reductase
VAERPVALITDASDYVGPALATLLSRTHDLVLGDPDDEVVATARAAGSDVAVVTGHRDLAVAGATETLVATALERFGRLDSAVAFTGAIVVGRFLRSDVDDLRRVLVGCVEAPYLFLRAVVPVMVEHGGGQVLLFTSAAGARPTPGAPLYSSARAAANMLVRNVADEVVDRNVQVNAIGTNFMDFPGFLRANRADEPEGRARVEGGVPMRRLGTMEELAHMALPFVDGTSRFTTGQFVAVAGGWV